MPVQRHLLDIVIVHFVVDFAHKDMLTKNLLILLRLQDGLSHPYPMVIVYLFIDHD